VTSINKWRVVVELNSCQREIYTITQKVNRAKIFWLITTCSFSILMN